MSALRGLLLLLLLPTVAAEMELIVEDPAGDVAIGSSNGSAGIAAPASFEWIDILEAGLRIEGPIVDVFVRLAAADEPAGDDGLLSARDGVMLLWAGEAPVQVHVWGSQAGRIDAGHRTIGDMLGYVEPYRRDDGRTSGVRVPLELIAPDVGGAAWQLKLQGVVVWHEGGYVDASDTIPSHLDRPLTVPASGALLADVRLRGDPDFRYSNGGQEVAVFGWLLQNLANHAQTLEVRLAQAPSDWRVVLPPGVQVPAGGEQWFPAVAFTPSGHVHGGRETLAVEVVAAGQTLRLNATTVYLEEPQLGGHHPTLHIHTWEETTGPYRGDERIWMNTMKEDAQATEHLRGARASTSDLLQWEVPLSRPLDLGLDFRGSEALLTLFMVNDGTLAAQSIEASLLYCHPKDSSFPTPGDTGCPGGSYETLLAGADDTVVDVWPHTYELPLVLRDGPTRLPPTAGATLRLDISLETDPATAAFPRALQPRIDPTQSTLNFPLRDYLPATGVTPGNLTLQAPSLVQLTPGSHVFVPVSADEPFHAVLMVLREEWPTGGIIAGRGEVGLPLSAPTAVPEGTVEAIVVAWDDSGPAVLPLTIDVVAGPPVNDREEGRKSPAALLPLAALLVAWARRG